MTKILAFAGKKGSGKNTLANFMTGWQLKSYNKIDNFDLTDTGALVSKVDGGEYVTIDMFRTDVPFVVSAMEEIWPFVKQYAFAKPLKDMLINLFNVPHESMYGSEEDKNKLLDHIKWENMPGVLLKSDCGSMSAREFMQYFGTEIMRKIYPSIWVNYCLDEIKKDDTELAIITDCRFDDELDAVHTNNGKVIYLNNVAKEDTHESENALTVDKCDAVIETNKTVIESCQDLVKCINEWGWI